MSELSVQCICCGLKAISCTASLAPLHEGCKIAATLVAQKLLVTNHWFTSIYTISCMSTCYMARAGVNAVFISMI